MLSKRSNNLTTQTLLDFDLEESSSDSDFRIEDVETDESDDYSVASKDQHGGNDGDGDDDKYSDMGDNSDSSESEDDGKNEKIKPSTLLDLVSNTASSKLNVKLISTPICCACLGERSDDTNEIVECDGCGVTVHEGCYGVSDSGSISSTVSSCSTEPWFCEACKAGITDPVCELCPNKGGIFKETDVGKWVHLVCALYIPGVAFGEVDQLTSVTLFEMQYSKWGSKMCNLCEDSTFARTGVCIGCDAGMCKNYFHVTCAQSNGLLSEAHSEEVDHADPFYAHCKLHSDKTLIKKRKRNFNALKMKMEQRAFDLEERKLEKPSTEQLRIERKLNKHKVKYIHNKGIKNEPWVPTQKMPRLLTTSASARRRLLCKAQLMGIDTTALEIQESQIAALVDVRKKWHIPPAFSVEFIAYYLDRIARLSEIKSNLKVQIDSNKKLLSEQQILREKYDQKMAEKQDCVKMNATLKNSINKLHSSIQSLCNNKILQTVETIGRAVPNIKPQNLVIPVNKPMTVPTAAALKMGVGFPLNNLPGTTNNLGRVLSTQSKGNDALLHDCGICKKFTDQHLLAKCDTCHFYYHLGCLNPPLTRHPKKSKLYGWQCSECDKSDDSEPDITLPKSQRRSRVRYSKDGIIPSIESELDQTKDSISMSIASEDITDASITSIDEGSKNAMIDLENSTPNRKRTKKMKNTQSKKPYLDEQRTPDIEAAKKEVISPKKDESKVIEPLKKELKIESSESTSSAVTTDISKNQQKSETMTADEKLAKKEKKKEKKLKKSESPIEKDPLAFDEKTPFLPQFTSEIITDDISNSHDSSHHKQNRKRKKDKHKSKYSSDSEKSPNKEHREHKRKHKRKDIEYTECTQITDGPHPRIKIKFKAIHYTGDDQSSSTPKFIYVPSVLEGDGIATPPAEPKKTSTESKPLLQSKSHAETKPSVETEPSTKIKPSVETKSQTESKSQTETKSQVVLKSQAETKTHVETKSSDASKSVPPSSVKQRSETSVGNIDIPSSGTSTTTSSSTATQQSIATTSTGRRSLGAGGTKKDTDKSLCCDVCNKTGTPQNIVSCDECRKKYHFACLDPPLKKSPKRRGYSWHCADCDPTETESN